MIRKIIIWSMIFLIGVMLLISDIDALMNTIEGFKSMEEVAGQFLGSQRVVLTLNIAGIIASVFLIICGIIGVCRVIIKKDK